MPKSKRLARMTLALAASIASFSCSTPPPAPLSPVEQLRRDGVAGRELAQRFESAAQFRNDAAVNAYLNELGQALAHSDPELRELDLRIFVVSRVSGSPGAWRNHGLPGPRVYVSATLLKTLKFENELAAAVAFELGHVRARTLIKRLSNGNEALFGAGAVFDFTDVENLAALEPAMEMLYQSGFDPRGMVSLLLRYEKDPRKSPIPVGQVPGLLENTRRIIALHAPLRNPIVRSERFLAIQQRIQKL